MSSVKIIGSPLKNIPWQDRPVGEDGIVWRHTGNPIVNWNPTKSTARIYNSAVMPL
ncbi:MAG TPA: glycosylase, partial [Clostridia bacterium]|nr:glycosylase [Clostridia bacterium]